MSQSYQPFGCHFGVEITDLHQVAEMNATAVTQEGMKNFNEDLFEDSKMAENKGKLKFIRPPHLLFQKGDFTYLKRMDVVYASLRVQKSHLYQK
jgi:hypothetical protein